MRRCSLFTAEQKTVEKYGKAYGTSSTRMVYDGPFVVQGWSPSTETWTLKKNPNYWDKNKVKLNKVKFVVTKNPQTALSLYTSGKLDNITLAGQQASQEKNNKGYLSYPSGEIDYIAYNFRNKALRNINIRKAISLTINRKSLVNNVLKTVPRYQPASPHLILQKIHLMEKTLQKKIL